MIKSKNISNQIRDQVFLEYWKHARFQIDFHKWQQYHNSVLTIVRRQIKDQFGINIQEQLVDPKVTIDRNITR